MNANNLYCAALSAALVCSTAGCQSWQGASFPMQNATRVPPPGTGTYQVPSGYYNNTTSALPAAQNMQSAGSTAGLRPAAGNFPTTNMPATNLASTNYASSSGSSSSGLVPSARGSGPAVGNNFNSTGPISSADFVSTLGNSSTPPVVAATHTQPSPSHAQYTAPLQSSAQASYSSEGAAARMTNSTSTEVPSLQWQQFGGQ